MTEEIEEEIITFDETTETNSSVENIDNNYIEGIVNRIKKIHESEFEIFGYEPEEYKMKEVVHKERKLDMIDFQKRMRKQYLVDKNKALREYDQRQTVFEDVDIDIFADETFNVVQEEEKKDKKRVKKKFSEIEREELIKMIELYMRRKRINLTKNYITIWENMKNDVENGMNINWESFVTMTMDGSEVVNVKFFKKDIMGDDIISLEEEEVLTKEDKTNLIKRKMMLNKFK